MRIDTITPVFVSRNPTYGEMKVGEVYVTDLGCGFLCPCGCGFECWLPFDPKDGWTITGNRMEISLDPSIGSRFPCNSHYFITNNKIVWQ